MTVADRIDGWRDRLSRADEGTAAWRRVVRELEEAIFDELDMAGAGGNFLTYRAELLTLSSYAGVLRSLRDVRDKRIAELEEELARRSSPA